MNTKRNSATIFAPKRQQNRTTAQMASCHEPRPRRYHQSDPKTTPASGRRKIKKQHDNMHSLHEGQTEQGITSQNQTHSDPGIQIMYWHCRSHCTKKRHERNLLRDIHRCRQPIHFHRTTPEKERSVSDHIVAALQYTTATFGQSLTLINSENAKEYLSYAVQEETRVVGTTTCTTIPHNPEENVLTICYQRCGIQARPTRQPHNGYQPIQSMAPHHSQVAKYNHLWTTWIYTTITESKMDDRSVLVRYVGMLDLRHIVVQLQNDTVARSRIAEFRAVKTDNDSTRTHRYAFASFADRLKHTPLKITPAPVHIIHARKIPRFHWVDGNIRQGHPAAWRRPYCPVANPSTDGRQTIPLDRGIQLKMGPK